MILQKRVRKESTWLHQNAPGLMAGGVLAWWGLALAGFLVSGCLGSGGPLLSTEDPSLQPPLENIHMVAPDWPGGTKEIKRRGMRAMIFVYYSGHGDPSSFHLGGDSLMLDEVRGFFSQAEADVKVLVADACHSGALISAKGAKLSGSRINP